MRYIDRYNWESFCQQYEKTENEMKSFLFKGKLSEKEFETLIDCSRHTFIDFGYYIDYGKLFISCPYEKSSLSQQREIKDFASNKDGMLIWDMEAIKKRKQSMIEAAMEIWSLDNI